MLKKHISRNAVYQGNSGTSIDKNKRVLESDVETCPASMTRTRSHSSTVCIECAMMISVQSLNVCRIVSWIRVAVSESSDDVASSSTTIYTIVTFHYRLSSLTVGYNTRL